MSDVLPRPLPHVTDERHRPFWDGTRARELRCIVCNSCSRLQWPPRPICIHCQSFDVGWRAVRAEGKVYSFIVVHRPMHPAFAPMAPYVIVLVELDEAPVVRYIGHAVGVDPKGVEVGLPVRAVFDRVTEDVVLVNWTPR